MRENRFGPEESFGSLGGGEYLGRPMNGERRSRNSRETQQRGWLGETSRGAGRQENPRETAKRQGKSKGYSGLDVVHVRISAEDRSSARLNDSDSTRVKRPIYLRDVFNTDQ